MLVRFGRVYYPPSGEFQRAHQDHYQLFYMDEGSVDLLLNGNLVSIFPDNCILFKPGDNIHLKFSNLHSCQHSWIDIFDYSADSLPELNLSFQDEPYSVSNQERSLLELMVGFDNYNIKTSDVFFTCLAELCLNLYLNKLNSRKELPPIIQNAQYYINKNFRTLIKAEDIANQFNVSHEYLIRIFQKHLKITPSKYLWQKRISEAQKRLENTPLTLNEISQQCGFQNQYHFSRKFKALTGVTPREYKRTGKT